MPGLAILVFLATVGLPTTPATANGCVTGSEYRAAKGAWRMEGLSLSGVHHYFGSNGTQLSRGDGRMTRRYTGCGREGDVTVHFRYVEAQIGKAWMAMRLSRNAGDRVRLCASSGRPSVYPFAFLLTTSEERTRNQAVRDAVRSIQKALRSLGIRDRTIGKSSLTAPTGHKPLRRYCGSSWMRGSSPTARWVLRRGRQWLGATAE